MAVEGDSDASTNALRQLWTDAPSLPRKLIQIATTHASARPHSAVRLFELRLPEFLLDDLRTLGKCAIDFICSDLAITQYGGRSPADASILLPPLKKRVVETVGRVLRKWDVGIFGSGVKEHERASDATWRDLSFQFLGAVSFEWGIAPIRVIARSAIADLPSELDTVEAGPKMTLQEILQASGKKPPKYEVLEQTGPAHALVFISKVVTPDGRSATGRGSKKRDAEAAAAAAYLVQYHPNRIVRKVKLTTPKPLRPHANMRLQLPESRFVQEIESEFEVQRADMGLLRLALVHTSYPLPRYEEMDFGRSNQLLATLGAHAFYWAAADEVCRQLIKMAKTESPSGVQLAPILSHIVSESSLVEISEPLKLQCAMFVGPGERGAYRVSILVESFQALVGALTLIRRDSANYGHDLLRSRTSFILKAIDARVQRLSRENRITLLSKNSQLQERCQAIGLTVQFEGAGLQNSQVRIGLRSIAQKRNLTVTLKAAAHELFRDAQEELAENLIDTFDFALGTLSQFEEGLEKNSRIVNFILDQVIKFVRADGMYAVLQRLRVAGDFGLFGSLLLEGGRTDDFTRWLAALLRSRGTEGSSLFTLIEGLYVEMGWKAFSKSTLARIADEVVTSLGAIAVSLDPLVESEDLRRVPEFVRLGEFARLARIASNPVGSVALSEIVSALEVLNREPYSGQCTVAPEDDAVIFEVRGSLVSLVQLIVDAGREAKSYNGRWGIRFFGTDDGIAVSLTVVDSSDAIHVILEAMEKSILWEFLRDILGIEETEAKNQTLTLYLKCKSDSGVEDFARRVSWSIRYGIPAEALSPMVSIAGVLHDTKNELLAFEAARQRTLRTISKSERYRLAAEASGHLETVQSLLLSARSIVGTIVPAQLRIIELRGFFRAFVIELMSWLPSSISPSGATSLEDTYVKIDDVRLRSMLTNLCRNSVEAMPAGGELGIEWAVDVDGGLLEIDLWDSGSGLQHEQMEQLNAGEPLSSTKEKGSGVGLLTVMLATRTMGGRIKFGLRVRGGLVVSLALPVEIVGENGSPLTRSAQPSDESVVTTQVEV